MRLYLAKVRPLAEALDLDLARTPVCLACLWIVASPVGRGDEREAKRSAREMTPYIWEEGLAEPALEAVRSACAAGVRLANECLADLEQRGCCSRRPTGTSVASRVLA